MNLNKMEVVLLASMSASTVDRRRARRSSFEQALNGIWGWDSIKKYTYFELLCSSECSSSLSNCLSLPNPASGPILVSSSLFVYCLQSLAAAFMLIK